MELPNYRIPSAKSVVRLIWDKAKGFVQKGFYHYFCSFGSDMVPRKFRIRLNLAASPEDSMLALLGSVVAPIFSPFRFWGLAYFHRLDYGLCG